jgi:hypothetical protein
MSEGHSQNNTNNCRCETSRVLRIIWKWLTGYIVKEWEWCYGCFTARNYHLSHVVLWSVIISSLVLNFFLIFFFLRYCHYLSGIGLKVLQTSGTTPNDSFTGNIVSFYQSLVTIQFSVIAVLLGICLFFTYTVSRKQIRETVQEELKSDYFLNVFGSHFYKMKEDEINNMVIANFNDQIGIDDFESYIKSTKDKLLDLESEIERLKETKLDRKTETFVF